MQWEDISCAGQILPYNNVCHICSGVANRPSSRDAQIFWSFVPHLSYNFLGMQISGFPTWLACWESFGNPMTPPDHHSVIDMVKYKFPFCSSLHFKASIGQTFRIKTMASDSLGEWRPWSQQFYRGAVVS
jgi:hypothetical protein